MAPTAICSDPRDLFDHRSMLTDVSGAGNNWAHGYAMYGPKYHDNLVESVRAAAEHCDSLQRWAA